MQKLMLIQSGKFYTVTLELSLLQGTPQRKHDHSLTRSFQTLLQFLVKSSSEASPTPLHTYKSLHTARGKFQLSPRHCRPLTSLLASSPLCCRLPRSHFHLSNCFVTFPALVTGVSHATRDAAEEQTLKTLSLPARTHRSRQPITTSPLRSANSLLSCSSQQEAGGDPRSGPSERASPD